MEYNLRYLHAVIEFHKYNMKMIHWKAKGVHFDMIHNLSESIYNMLNSYADLVAEMGMMNYQLPVEMQEIITILNSSEEPFIYLRNDALFDEVSAITEISDILSQIMKISNRVKESLTDEEASEIDSYLYKMKLEVEYKCKMRLK